MSYSKPSDIDSWAENSRPLSNVIVLTFSFISAIALMASSASRSARLPVNPLIIVYKALRSTSFNNTPLRPLPITVSPSQSPIRYLFQQRLVVHQYSRDS